MFIRDRRGGGEASEAKERVVLPAPELQRPCGLSSGDNAPLGNVANEVLRLKRMETHKVFDDFWKGRRMSRTAAYKWLSKKMGLPEEKTHIGGFEMDQCQQVIDICRQIETAARNTEAA